MKLVIFTVLLFSLSLVVFSAKLGKNEEVNVVRSDQSIQADSYKFSYELDNGVKAEESGHLNEDEEFVSGFLWILSVSVRCIIIFISS